MNNIIVYDNYEIEFNKYPRVNTDKCNTDIIIIVFLMHENFLKKLACSYEEALKYYNDCKDHLRCIKNTKFNCECGGKYTYANKAKHLKNSKKHVNFIENKSINNNIE